MKTALLATRTALVTGFCAAAVALMAVSPALAGSPKALEKYYGNLQSSLTSKGFLRMERDPSGSRLSAKTLAEEFRQIALNREYSTGGKLMRWESSVRFQMAYAPSVGEADRKDYNKGVRSYINRLAKVTGHRMGITRDNGNFLVVVANSDEIRGLGPYLEQNVPGISGRAVRMATRMNKDKFCMVITVPHADPTKGIQSAVAILRAEHTGRMRQACIEEELAQGLGLPNDYAKATASIFNDDTKYAVLTRNDELLLKMLYNRRLQSGMSVHQCEPIVAEIADGLL